MDAWEYIHEERYRPRPGQEPDKPVKKARERVEIPSLPPSLVDDEVSVRRRRRELDEAMREPGEWREKHR